MTYETIVADLGDRTAAGILALWQMLQDGDIDRATFVDLATTWLDLARLQGTAVADLSLAAVLAPRELPPRPTDGDPAEADRLTKALRTILEDPDQDPVTRLERLGRSTALAAAAAAYMAGVRRSGATYWTRVVNVDACKPCANRAGEKRPADVDMWQHPGCLCAPLPA